MGDVRGWGVVVEPLSLSQAAEWAGRSADMWADVFHSALSKRIVFSPTPDTLDISSKTPRFDSFMEGTVHWDYLLVTGISKWYIDAAPAGVLESAVTSSSECLLALQSPAISVSFNNEFPSSHVIAPIIFSDRGNQHSPSVPSNESDAAQTPSSVLPSTTQSSRDPVIPPRSSSPSISITSTQQNSSNYLAILTLAWTYVLSAYWAEIQGGVIQYTTSRAPILGTYKRTSPEVIPLHLPEETAIKEKAWWCAVLAPTGWVSWIERYGREWISPWSLSMSDTTFAVIDNISLTDETDYEPLSFSRSVIALRNFAKSYSLLGQARMALIASFSVPTYNLYKIPVNLPRPRHRISTIIDEEPQAQSFDGLVELIPQLVTISSSTYASHIRSAFYDDSIHSMECGQWVRPAIVGWPEFSPLAVAVGSIRCPELIHWWGGMGISGLLSKHAVGRLAGSCMWPTDLAFFAWTGAKHSYFCKVEEEDIQLTVNGRGKSRVISRADEALMLVITSGQGPYRRLSDLTSCPWRPPGEVWFEKSGSRVIRAGDEGLKARLVYLS